MNSPRAVWVIRLTGLVPLLLAAVAFSHAESLAKWLGDVEWMRIDPDEVVQFGSIVAVAVSFRLLVFGLRVWARTGIILLIFVGWDVFVEYWARRPPGDTNLYYDEGVGSVLWLYVLLPAAASLLLAAVPLPDARFQNQRTIVSR
jgi:hypothetical protein